MSSSSGQAARTSVDLCRFAIDEAIRALGREVEAVERLRLRSFAFVGVTATAMAFLVGAALEADTRGGRFFGPLVLGTAAFVLCLAQLWRTQSPIAGWQDQISARVIVNDFASFDSEVEAYIYLAGFYDQAVESNQVLVDRLARRVQWLTVWCAFSMLSSLLLVWLVAA